MIVKQPNVLEDHRLSKFALERGNKRPCCRSFAQQSPYAVQERGSSGASTSGREDSTEPRSQAVSIGTHDGKVHSRQWKRPAFLTAKAVQSLEVAELQRPIAEYMALPASQYSVLDAQRIERIDDNTFCCFVGSLRFFGIRVEPVLTVSVNVGARGPTVRLLSTVLEGSPVVQAANNRFDATMTNVVTWSSPPSPLSNGNGTGSKVKSAVKQFESDAIIQVSLEIPGWMRAIPVGAIEKTGSSVMQRVLNKMLPRFLQQLKADYELWASGDQSRTPIGTGKL